MGSIASKVRRANHFLGAFRLLGDLPLLPSGDEEVGGVVWNIELTLHVGRDADRCDYVRQRLGFQPRIDLNRADDDEDRPTWDWYKYKPSEECRAECRAS